MNPNESAESSETFAFSQASESCEETESCEEAERLETTESCEQVDLSSGPMPIQTLVIAPGRVLPRYLNEADSSSPEGRISDSKWATLIVLFVVTAVLGIPMLWRNPRFSLLERLFWSSAVILYTIAIFGLLVWWIRSTVARIE